MMLARQVLQSTNILVGDTSSARRGMHQLHPYCFIMSSRCGLISSPGRKVAKKLATSLGHLTFGVKERASWPTWEMMAELIPFAYFSIEDCQR